VIVHAYFNRMWDQLSKPDRESMAESLREVLLDIDFLISWADVDVVRGLIKVTYGPQEGFLFPVERWEAEPSLPHDYVRLARYIRGRPVERLI